MNAVRYLVAMALPCIALTAQAADPISTVKNSTQFNYKDKTIGQAYDMWSDCESGHWKTVITAQAGRMVEFNCEVKGLAVEFTKLKAMEKDPKMKEMLGAVVNMTWTYQWSVAPNGTQTLSKAERLVFFNNGKSGRFNRLPVAEHVAAVYNNKTSFADLTPAETVAGLYAAYEQALKK